MVVLTVSALMWALVLVLVVFRRTRKERSVLYAAITIAVTMMLNDDDLYFVVDRWFGSRDIVHLLAALALMVGVTYLAQGITRSGMRYLSRRASLVLLTLACTITTVAFFLIPHQPGTTASFMATYGQHPAAAVYSATGYVYFLVVFTALSATAVTAVRTRTMFREQAAGLLLLVGSVCTLALSVDVIGMDITHLLSPRAMRPWQAAYSPLHLLTFLFLTAGLATAPIGRWVTETRYQRRITRLLGAVTPLWETAVAVRTSPALPYHSDRAEDILHRRIVEVRDTAMDQRATFTLTAADRVLLAAAEEQLTAGAR